MIHTYVTLNQEEGAALAAQLDAEYKKRKLELEKLGAKTCEGIIRNPDGSISGFQDGKD